MDTNPIDHSKQHFYGAAPKKYGFLGRVYHYDKTGNLVIDIYLSDKLFATKNEAIDDACQWTEDNNIDAKLDS